MDHRRPYRFVFQLLISLQIVWGLDEVILLNPPAEPVSGHVLKVLYSCDHPSVVQLDCVVSFDTGPLTLLLRHWSCVPGNPKVKRLILTLPDWLVYRADGIVPDSHWVLSVMVRASLRGDGSDDGDRSALVRDVVTLQPTPPLSRPLKRHQLCHAWSTQMLWLTHRTSKTQCPLEQETVHLLSSVFASTGENFGITKTLHAYSSDVLERLRLKAVTFPWCVFSVWVFLIRHCQQSMCGLFYHIDSDDNYATPAVLLTSSGQLHVQMDGQSGESSAFLCPFTVLLNQWCHLNMVLRGRTVALSMVCVDGEQRTARSAEHTFRHTIVLDDTDGYFGLGGGKFVRGVEGYYGPLEYYRNRVPPYSTSEVVVPELVKNVNLTGWIQTCDDFRFELFVKIRGYSLRARQKAESERCAADAYHNWLLRDTQQLNSQCEPWEATLPQRRHAAKLAKILALKHGGREVNLTSVGGALYSLSLRKLGKVSSAGAVSRIIALLLQAGCLGDNRALHLSSVLYSSGLGTKRQPNKAWLLALLAAQKDWRLALLRLGHLHHQGDHGIPSDTDLAYAYYANIAKQTAEDRENPSPQQKFVESIYLNDEEALKLQTHENDDLFHWLKHQARRGAAEAEQTVARMLFWGQQGVTPDIEKAARHYERGAVRLGDPVSMYNYAIVLIQGHGVKKDVQKAVTFLKKAVKQGSAPAMNALGWYYEQFERDYERAVQLWEQADLHGSPDAAMNLGVMYSQGLYPGKAADQFVAYTYYLKSAERGLVTGVIHVAEIWITGMPGRVTRRPAEAVLWMKWAAEHNGYLGDVLRKALDSYFKSDMLMSLLYYTMAAEAGYAAAQFNVAYLCEQNTGRFLDPAFAAHCMRRYYNLTTRSPNPASYALIRMGDLLYEGHEGHEGHKGRQTDAMAAARMYKLAALRNEPQGWYNLGLLVQEGHKLPISILTELGLQELYLADNIALLTTLYGRCRDSNGTESYLPCSLALFNTYLQAFQKDYRAAIEFSGAVVMVVAAPPVLFIILGVLRRCGFSLHWAR